MLLQKCNKNHFYNKDKFKQCPYCALEKSGLEDETDSFSVRSVEKTDRIIERIEDESFDI